MKKTVCILLSLVILFTLAGCSSGGTAAEKEDTKTAAEKPDVDLTALSSTMVYSEVYNMMTEPDDYIGKTVKMSGQFSVYQMLDEDGNPVEGAPVYYACVIADATACCQQGLEFVLDNPDDYPAEAGTEITVEGVFKTYYEEQNMYCHLVNAHLCEA